MDGINRMSPISVAPTWALWALPTPEMAGMQPYQLTRKQVVWGRWVALWLKKGIRPCFKGMRLLVNGQAGGWMPVLRNGWGTFKRLKGQGDAIV